MSESSATGGEFATATAQFERLLARLRAVEHFAIGRRVLALIALSHYAPMLNMSLRGVDRSGVEGPGLSFLASAIRHAADDAGEVDSALGATFQTLAPDVLQSRWEETAVYAGRILNALPAKIDDQAFGAWWSERLDQIVTSGPQASEVGTPPQLAEFMTFLAAIPDGASVYDPCCGLGGLLAQASRAARSVRLVGEEIHPLSVAFARLRFHLLGLPADIERRDALRDLGGETFDRVLCDPPLGVYAPLAEEAGSRLVARRRDAVFLEKCLASLAPGGRAVVLVSQAVLVRRGHEQELRRRLLEARILEAVISLPPGLVTWTSVELALLVLSRAGQRRSAKILDGGVRGGRGVRPAQALANLKVAYLEGQSDSCREMPYARLLAADNLLPRVLLAPQQERPDPRALRAAADALLRRAEARRPRIEALFDRILGPAAPPGED